MLTETNNLFDQNEVTTYSIHKCKHLVHHQDFAQIPGTFLDRFPNILKGKELREIVQTFYRAVANSKPIIWAIGGHVIKCGLSPLLLDLMTKKMVTAIAMNGAAAIHDFEIAFWGKTSEDVKESLKDGSFGMAYETANQINHGINTRVDQKTGLGEALQREMSCWRPEFGDLSLIRESFYSQVPVTIHVTLGADVIHMHPEADGTKIGQGSLNDFRLLTSLISTLEGGGIFLNVGSAVVLPEVFLKALNLARNLGHVVDDFVTVNLDMIQHYRPNENVVIRPHVGGKGKGYSLTGHHEIMIPLLYSLLTKGI